MNCIDQHWLTNNESSRSLHQSNEYEMNRYLRNKQGNNFYLRSYHIDTAVIRCSKELQDHQPQKNRTTTIWRLRQQRRRPFMLENQGNWAGLLATFHPSWPWKSNQKIVQCFMSSYTHILLKGLRRLHRSFWRKFISFHLSLTLCMQINTAILQKE